MCMCDMRLSRRMHAMHLRYTVVASLIQYVVVWMWFCSVTTPKLCARARTYTPVCMCVGCVMRAKHATRQEIYEIVDYCVQAHRPRCRNRTRFHSSIHRAFALVFQMGQSHLAASSATPPSGHHRSLGGILVACSDIGQLHMRLAHIIMGVRG